ncbi:MAG: hypothetical protein ACI3W5_05100 [Faecousia sp.]
MVSGTVSAAVVSGMVSGIVASAIVSIAVSISGASSVVSGGIASSVVSGGDVAAASVPGDEAALLAASSPEANTLVGTMPISRIIASSILSSLLVNFMEFLLSQKKIYMKNRRKFRDLSPKWK